MIDLIAGARPNFMKLAPVLRALDLAGAARPRIVHTGQHYDHGMSDVFFEELGIRRPDVHLEVGSGSQGAQTARILERYEAHLLRSRPRATVVFGDVNSTVACALAAVKLAVPVAHVEAGLRSFDRSMPEEINRILTDAMADLLLVSEPSGIENLAREGVAAEKTHLVGNVMIDSLLRELPAARSLDAAAGLGLEKGQYGLVTLHRPSNVDDPRVLRQIVELLARLANRLALVFPMHPRTRTAVTALGLDIEAIPGLHVISPVPYRSNLSLMADAAVVLTDSGGMQEETSVLGIPCLTLRQNTERPITVAQGTSRLVGNDSHTIAAAFDDALAGRWRSPQPIPLWDGKAGERIAGAILDWMARLPVSA